MDLRALRSQIRHDRYVAQTIGALLETARTTDDLVEKRRAATAVIRLLFPSRVRSSGSSGSPARAPREGAGGRAPSPIASSSLDSSSATAEARPAMRAVTAPPSPGAPGSTPPDVAEPTPSRGLQSPQVCHPDQAGLPDTDSPPQSRRLQSPQVSLPIHAEISSTPTSVAPPPLRPSLRERLGRAERTRREHIERFRRAARVAPIDST
jgi:hypothetical protein